MIEWTLRKIIGTKNDRELKRSMPVIARINELEPQMRALSDEDFPRQTAEWKQQVENGKSLDDLLIPAFALAREAARRTIGQRHFDVQLVGGRFMHMGCIAEMRTGEGKTLTATAPSYLNALSGRGVHVVTVNDYLARRDAEWMGQVHRFLGLSVGCVLHDMKDAERQAAYRADITYGQNNEFGFDYLRDNMKFQLQDYVQRELNFAIVDEVDSILIDEARTPLIISGPTDSSTDRYYQVDKVMHGLVLDQDYTLDEKARSAMLTDAGIEKIQKRLEVPNLYAPDMIETLHHVEQSLRAHTIYKRDRDYMVRDGQVLIIDEFTGRLMAGRRWSDGLHQAVEAKEGVRIENENQTLATISFQNYFRMYTKLSGMTGTADTEAEEFASVYNLDVRVIPTNRPMIRKDLEDQVFRTEREKFDAITRDIRDLHASGQPVLVGTVSVSKSEALAGFLRKAEIPHEVLNAKQHQREATIVAQAGRLGAVTISTNMAGRGTDIHLGGNAEVLAQAEAGDPPVMPQPSEGAALDLSAYERERAAYDEKLKKLIEHHTEKTRAERDEVKEKGGLYILGTERHESRRIDNQLRGRAGRQGDPGVSRFYLSLEDDLMRIFASDRMGAMMERLGMEEGEVIEHRWLSKAIEGAQRRVEGHNFDIRKNMLEYDDVMNQQRRTIYKLRRRVLAAGAGIPLVEFEEDPRTKEKTRTEETVSWPAFKELVLDAVEEVIVNLSGTYLVTRSAEGWELEGFTRGVKESLFLDMDFTGASSREEIQDQVFAKAKGQLDAREGEFGEDFLRFCQYQYLSTIDRLWKDHLLAMDHLRQGIGLRGYGQRDPKQEYKKEGYSGFQQMLSAISFQFVSQISRVMPKSAAEEAERLRQEMAQKQRRMQLTESHDQETAEAGGAKAAAPAPRKPIEREGPRVGRNDPCPCGSGKKYKKCHGSGELTA